MPDAPRLLALALLSLILASGCKKDRVESDSSVDDGYVTEYASFDGGAIDAQRLAAIALETGALSGYARTTGGPATLGGCATITRDTVSVPHRLTIDFGTTNCTGTDGVSRRGAIACTYTGALKDSGAVHVISYQNFYRNDHQLVGRHRIVNTGKDSLGRFSTNIDDSGALILASGAGTRLWQRTSTRVWTAGYGTPAWADDAFSTVVWYGLFTGVNGKRYLFGSTLKGAAVQEPLQSAMNCRWVKSGKLGIVRYGSSSYPPAATWRYDHFLDYGTGSCDNSATLTGHGTVRTVALP